MTSNENDNEKWQMTSNPSQVIQYASALNNSREVKPIINISKLCPPLPKIYHPFPIKPDSKKNSSIPLPSFRKIVEMRSYRNNGSQNLISLYV